MCFQNQRIEKELLEGLVKAAYIESDMRNS